MKKYRHLFFDLDGTLWDLNRNTLQAFRILFSRYADTPLAELDFETFLERYLHHNDIVWKLYRQDKIEKAELRIVRFERAFADVGHHPGPDFIQRFADEFIEECPSQPHLVSGTLELLQALHGKFPIHIITNGFKEIQHIKMSAGGITHFFDEVINSEDCGVRKPHRAIFEYALQKAGASVDESLMIGDDWEADILGARDFGMDQAWLRNGSGRHNYTPTFTIGDMHDLKKILLS